MRIDSWDTLPPALCSAPPYEDTQEEGVVIDVPPGDYLATLHRVDVDATSRKLDVDLDGPAEIVTLTPLAPADPRPQAVPLLAYEGSADHSWPRRYSIEGHAFEGLVLFSGAESQILLNLDREAAARLGLRAGMGLTIRASSPAVVSEAFVVREETSTAVFSMPPEMMRAMQAFAEWREEDATAVPADVSAGEWVRAGDWFGAFRARLPPGTEAIEILRFMRLGESTRIPTGQQMEWVAVEVEVLPRPNLPEPWLRKAGLLP